jgi:hypothetical protein
VGGILMETLGFRIGVVPNVNGKPSWDGQEQIIIDNVSNKNSEREYDYRVVYKVSNKDDKKQVAENKEVSTS